MKNLLKHPLLKILILSQVALACTKKVEVQHHDRAVSELDNRQSAVQDLSYDQSVAASDLRGKLFSDKAALAQTLKTMNATLAKKQTSSDEIFGVVLKLQEYVFSPTLIDDAETRGSDELYQVLSVFNRALLRSTQAQPTEGTKGVLKKYINSLMQDCESGIQQCPRLSFFGREALTTSLIGQALLLDEASVTAAAQVLNTAANCRSNLSCLAKFNKNSEIERAQGVISGFYRRLHLAIDMQNRSVQNDLMLLYIRNSQNYIQYFNSKPLSTALKNEMKNHRDILSMFIQQVQSLKSNDVAANDDFCKFIISSKPFEMSQANAGLLDSATIRGFMSEFVTCSQQTNSFDRTLVSFINKRQQESQKKVKKTEFNQLSVHPRMTNSYFEALGEIQKMPWMVKALGISTSPIQASILYPIEMYFYDLIDLPTATMLLQKLPASEDQKVFLGLKQYIQVQTAHLARATFIIFTEHFKRLFAQNQGLSTNLFSDVIEQTTNDVSADFDKARARVSRMLSLLEQVYSPKYQRVNTSLSNQYLSLKYQLEYYNQNLNYLVTSPLNHMLDYYMGKAQGTIKFAIGWWPGTNKYFETDGQNALRDTFSDSARSSVLLFPFGELNKEMTPIQKVHGFDFAMRAGLTSIFPLDLLESSKKMRLVQKDGFSGNNEWLFFKEWMSARLRTTDSTLRKRQDELKSILNNNDFTVRLQRMCDQPLAVTARLTLSDFTTSPYSSDKFVTEKISSFYSAASEAQAAKVEIDETLRMLQLIKANLERGSDSVEPGKVQTKEAFYKRALGEIGTLRGMANHLVHLSLTLDKLLVNQKMNCLERLVGAEQFRRHKLLSLSLDFYKQVHAAMALLQVSKELKSSDLGKVSGALTTWVQKNLGADNQATVSQDVSQRMKNLLATLNSSGLYQYYVGQKAADPLSKALNSLLGIHNQDKAPFRNGARTLGFFVEGIETASIRPVKAVGKFTGQQFTHAKWDTMMRLRSQLLNSSVKRTDLERYVGTLPALASKDTLPLAQNTYFDLGSIAELERETLYTENASEEVFYSNSQKEFVQSAMKQLITYANWLGSGGELSRIQSRNDFRQTLFNMNVLETASETNLACYDFWGRASTGDRSKAGQQKCSATRVGAQQLVQDYIGYIDLIRLDRFTPGQIGKAVASSPMAQLLVWLDELKTDDLVSEFQFNNEESSSQWTWFDQWYKSKFLSRLESNVAIHILDGKEQFEADRDIHRLNIGSNINVIALNPVVDQIERNGIREKIVKFLERAKEIEITLRDLEQKKVNLGSVLLERTKTPRSDESVYGGEWRILKVNQRSSGAPIYLKDSDGEVTWYEGYVRTFFVKETECSALPRLGDPDYVGAVKTALESVKDKDCATRFQTWNRVKTQERAQFVQKSIYDWSQQGL